MLPRMDFALFLFALATSGTPGPNVLMVATSAANHGIRPVVPHMLGITLGFPALILACGLGLGSLFEWLPWLHRALQLAGALWMLTLAWKIATAPPPGVAEAKPPLGFWGAAAFQWMNPKAWMIALAALPTFTTPGQPMLPQVAVIAVVFAAVTLPTLAGWAWMGREAGRWLATPRRLAAFNWTMAALLVLSLVPLVLR